MSNFNKKYGPWALVTGASSGLGKEIALELAKRGLNVAINSRNKTDLEPVAKAIEEHQVKSKLIEGDVSSNVFLNKLVKELETLDVGLVVAAAGFGSSGEFITQNIDNELNMIDVNCKASLRLAHYFGSEFATKKRGGIILFGSLVGFQGTPYSANYAATKGYIQILAEGLHYELKHKGVDVLCVAPGPVATGFAKRANMQMGQAANPKHLAVEILNALGKKNTVKPGFLSKLLITSLSFLPKWLRIRIMANIMGGMAQTK